MLQAYGRIMQRKVDQQQRAAGILLLVSELMAKCGHVIIKNLYVGNPCCQQNTVNCTSQITLCRYCSLFLTMVHITQVDSMQAKYCVHMTNWKYRHTPHIHIFIIHTLIVCLQGHSNLSTIQQIVSFVKLNGLQTYSLTKYDHQSPPSSYIFNQMLPAEYSSRASQLLPIYVSWRPRQLQQTGKTTYVSTSCESVSMHKKESEQQLAFMHILAYSYISYRLYILKFIVASLLRRNTCLLKVSSYHTGPWCWLFEQLAAGFWL